MEDVVLSNTANQQVRFSNGDSEYTIRLRQFRGILYADVSVEGELVVAGVRCVVGKWLIPYEAMNETAGNFRFDSETEDYPGRAFFETGECVLRYYDAEEIRALETGGVE